MVQKEPAILLFDGICHLCNSSVQFVLKHDRSARFHFASLQSEVAKQFLAAYQQTGPLPESVILLYEGKVYSESDAVIQTLVLLGGIWKSALVFKLVPRFIRNAVYRWIAKNRYRWFGKYDSCSIPQPQWKSRFLD